MSIPDYLLRMQPTQGEEIDLDLNTKTIDIMLQKQNNLQKATEQNTELKILKEAIKH